MSSGVNFGFMLSLPHMLGVSLGFVIMAILVGLGIMQLFELFPVSYQVLKILSVVYMVYLATKIARSSTAIGDIKTKVKPITFF
jgi:threonine/homoserine/homoserine lactone efflux protein